MPDEQLLLTVIDMLYDAALNPDQWTAALQGYANLIGARGAHLVLFETLSGAALFGVVAGFPLVANDEYIADYAAGDERLPRFHALPPGRPAHNYELLTDEERRRSPTYNEFLRKYDGQEQLLVHLEGPNATEVAIAGVRSVRDGPFEAEAVAFARATFPHFARAIEMQARLGGLAGFRSASEDAFELLPTGVVMLDQAGRIVHANRAARAIVGANDGFTVADGAPAAGRAREDAMLQRLIGEAILTSYCEGNWAGGVLAVPRPSGKRAYAVRVAPVPQTPSAPPLAEGPPAAMLFVSDPEVAPLPPRDVVRQLYGLTAREIDLALALAGGERVESAADRLGLATATARAHLKRVLAKTDTHSQAQLVALLLRTLPFADDKSA